MAKREDLLGNRLVVIVAKDSTFPIAAPEDLTGEHIKRLALADPAAVPAGVYAREALEKLGLWEQLSPRVAAGADVRQALDFVATGAAEAGIVYASDVAAQDKVRIACEFPAELSQSIRYPLILLKDAGPPANQLYAFLATPEAKQTFERHGFRVLTTAPPTEPHTVAPPPAVNVVSKSGWLSSNEWQALRLSLQVGVCAVLVSLPLAVAAGYYLAQHASPGKWLVELAVNLPLVLPPVVTGYLLLVLFAPRRPIGAALEDWFGVRIVFTWIGAALAAAVVSFPLMVRAIRLAFQSIDPRLEMAARSLGATRAARFLVGLAAAGSPRCARRLHSGVRPRPGRVRRHDHDRRQHCGRNADHSAGDLQQREPPRRRGRGLATGPALDRARRQRPGSQRMARTEARRP